MSLDFLLLYLGEGVKFDRERIQSLFPMLPGVSDVEQGELIGAILQARVDSGSDSTIIRLKPDLETISLSGSGEAALMAALQIQRLYVDPIHLIDSDYSFDIDLSNFNTIEALCKQIAQERAH